VHNLDGSGIVVWSFKPLTGKLYKFKYPKFNDCGGDVDVLYDVETAFILAVTSADGDVPYVNLTFLNLNLSAGPLITIG
jgi:hypothetical protein